MSVRTSLRWRWPEAALVAVLVVGAIYAGLALRSLAILLAGGVALFAIRRRVRDVVLGAFTAVVLLLVTIVVSFTVDLGAVLGGIPKALAEQQGSKYLERPLHLGRLSLQVARGRFIVEDILIEGLKPADTPFFTAKRVNLDLPWWQILTSRQLVFRSVELGDWRMLIEERDGRHNMPRLKPRSTQPAGPKRFTTRVDYVHAFNGQFTYIDHGSWRTVASNLDLYIRNVKGQYLGTATITGGSVAIKDYVPMRSDMRVTFRIDGGIIRLPEIVLLTDGARSVVSGEVDFGHWPNMLYRVDSMVNLSRMREIFFAHESWRSRGEASFKGTFRLFKGGHELKGDFASPLAYVNAMPFPDLRGSLIWEPHRFEVTHATARFCGGAARFRYGMAPLSDPRPAVARWDIDYENVDLGQFSDVFTLHGLRLLGQASGTNHLEWPLGRFAGHRGEGRVVVTPPADRVLLERAPAPGEEAIHAEPPRDGPEPDIDLFPLPTAIGGEFSYRFDPEWLEVDPSHLATERTYVEFQGRTAYGDRSEFPFYARSADWQESDRLLAGIITAVGSPTGIIKVGGYGEFRGTMTKAFRDPLVEGRFTGEALRAWDVVWGRATGQLQIEDGYVRVTDGLVTSGTSEVRTDGLFSLGYPRKDGREEINARFVVKDRTLRDLRHAFELDDWPLDGKVSGELRLFDRYTRPVGYGRLVIADAVAWGEPMEAATGTLRFEGTGMRIDAARIRKSTGEIRGAAYVGWDGRYSFNADGQRIPMESVATVKYGKAQWSGQLNFAVSGTATFKQPRYGGHLNIDDLFVGDEGIGQVVAHLSVEDRLLTVEQLEVASPRLVVSGSGRVEMSPAVDAEVSLRFTNTSLDPYLRLFEPRLSPYTGAIASGSIRVVGQLANPDRLLATATVDDLRLKLFDYALRNDGPLRLVFENGRIKVAPPPEGLPAGEEPKLRMVGEGTRLELGGEVGVKENRIGITASGDANLAVLQAFFRNVRSSGRATLRAGISGPLTKPDFFGEATITDGRVRHFSLPNSIQAINGRVTFGADGIRLEGLTAQVAGGSARFGGLVEMSGYTIGQLALTATGEKMEFRLADGFRATADAQFDLVGTMAAPTLRGNVLVTSATYTKPFDASVIQMLRGSRSPAGDAGAGGSGGAAASSAPTLPLRYDIRIKAPSSVRIDNNMLHIVASADLVLRGSYDRPLLFGRAEVDRGVGILEGKRYVLRHLTIDNNNPTKIEPAFDLAAETLVRVPGQTYIVNVQVGGTLNQLSPPQFTSDPPLPRLEIISLLFGGDSARAEARDAELRTLQSEQTQRDLATARATQAAAAVVLDPVSRGVQEAFGLDTVQLTPTLSPDQAARMTATARLTIGKQISNRLYLTYSRSLNASSGADQLILVEYDQNDRLSWIFSRNEDGTYALDVRVRHVF